jgi:hypothetical protein
MCESPNVMLQYMCTLCNVQIQVNISLNIYHFFVKKTFKTLFSNFFI